ncbi:MAG: tetraacyldisaccharide 4'-kinase [Gammaproteobacteria bacterium]|nr:tetraacyldisaccharide 4'-kinase [Gammaproteobacteria bacterium]
MPHTDLVEQVWYGEHKLAYVLAPLSWLYKLIIYIRRFAYGCGLIPVRRFSVPVIVIGNITVGGTGKTPLTIWLANYLKNRGMKPGIVSRGYGVRSEKPQQVRPDSNPFLVGDEPVLIARQTRCPVAIAGNRVQAVTELLEHYDLNVIISDDGLQHLPLYRDIEIAVIDGDRRFGNGRCLPAGPLREPVSTLERVDLVIANSKAGKGEHVMEYESGELKSLVDPDKTMELAGLRGQSVHAVVGIGNPARFISRLRREGLQVIKHIFPDHHPYQRSDLDFGDDLPVVMTEKDAVKCEGFATSRCWYLPVFAKPAETFIFRLDKCLAEINSG